MFSGRVLLSFVAVPAVVASSLLAAPAVSASDKEAKRPGLSVKFRAVGTNDVAVVRDRGARAGKTVRLRIHTSKGVRVVKEAETNRRGVARFVIPERFTTENGRLMSVRTADGRVRYFRSVDGAPFRVDAVPAAPRNLVVEAGNEQVFLSWAPVVNASRYRAVVRTADGQETYGPWVVTTSTMVSGLENDVRITVGVQGANDDGPGAVAFQGGVKPTASVPGDIPSLDATPGDSQVTLTWYPAPRADDYVVKYRPVGGARFTTTRPLPGSGENSAPVTSTITGLVNGTPYEFIVYPENDFGRGNDVVTDATPDFNHIVVEYPNTAFAVGEDRQILSPVTRGAQGDVVYSVSGVLPDGVVFDPSSGDFTGPSAEDWGFIPVDISAGPNHVCAVTSVGGVKCWGDNAYGQLGDGTRYNRSRPVDVVSLNADALNVSAGDTHTCATLVDGTVECWGDNTDGALGNGTFFNSNVAVPVSGLTSAVKVAAGGHHTCATLVDGTVECWGDNTDGALGNGTYSNSNVPATVTGVAQAVDVTAGADHTCAVIDGGSVECWGSNSNGQLGDGTFTSTTTAVEVVDMPGVASSVDAGGNRTCLVADGAAYCFGANEDGAVGNGGFSDVTKPAAVKNIVGVVTTVATGGDHSCATTQGGDSYCWGSNAYGQLGDGSTIDRSGAVKVTSLAGASVTVGGQFSCGISLTGDAKCWGRNNFGQLGDGTVLNRTVPVLVFRFNDLGFPATVTVTATDTTGSSDSVSVTLTAV